MQRDHRQLLVARPKFPIFFCRTTFDEDAPERPGKLSRCRQDSNAKFIFVLESDTEVSWVNLVWLGKQGLKMRA